MPDAFNEGKVKAQLAGEKLYARPKLDRLPAGAPRALTRTEALAALQDAHQSVGGGLYEKVTRAILADVDKPPASPEPPPQKKKRVEVCGVTDALWHNVKKAEESKKQKSNALLGEFRGKVAVSIVQPPKGKAGAFEVSVGGRLHAREQLRVFSLARQRGRARPGGRNAGQEEPEAAAAAERAQDPDRGKLAHRLAIETYLNFL